MKFFHKRFETKQITLYPLGDWHYGSRQCNETFIKQIIREIKRDDDAYWVGMGDFMENAVVGSKSDVYTQTLPPKEQMEYIVEILSPIKEKGLFLIAGNHESRTHRMVGLTPEQYIGIQLDVPYCEFSCLAVFQMESKTPNSFTCYMHHNYGGGYTHGGKVNRADALRKIVPTADAIFSGHFHITSRIPCTWYDAGRTRIIKHVGYDYITGSALEWDGSYAEERGKPSATVEHIKVTFRGCTSGKKDNRRQTYKVITPRNMNHD